MNKWIKIGFPILCVLVVIVTFYLLHNAQSKIKAKEETNTTKVENVVNEVEEENTVEVENTVNEVEPEEIKTTVEQGGASSASLYENPLATISLPPLVSICMSAKRIPF